MSISRPKVASIVASQLPEFAREDYPTFLAFLEAYYEFLDQNYNQDLRTLRDIDTTLDGFLKYFKDELATKIPYTVVNERFLLTNIKDQYLAKGSEASFKLLFRLLFNKDVTIEYPSKQILRASDGKWNQDISVFGKVNAGHPDMIVGKLVDVVTPNKIIRVLVDRRQDVEIEVDRVVQISPDTYEFYIDRRFFGNISVGDRLRYGGIFDATIVSTTSKITIQQGGRDFKIGQLYAIKNGNGAGSILKITSVDELGSIKSLEFIKYGIGYDTDFTATFLAQTGQTITGTGATALNIVGNQVGIYDTTTGFTEAGTINRVDYTADEVGVAIAWDGTYAGDVVREFFADNKDQVINPEDPAIIKVNLGPIAKYPGYYTNNDGFLDDAIYIQDSRYYQAFAYVIKIDQRLDDYRSAVKTLIHPAGMALFGEYDIRNEFDVSVALESLIKILAVNMQDEFSLTDVIPAKDFGKALEDSITVPEAHVFLMEKLVDSTCLDLDGNPVVDSISLSDVRTTLFTKGITNTTANYDDVVELQRVTLSDSTTNAFTKLLNHTTLNNSGVLDNNSVVMIDSNIYSFTKRINSSMSGYNDTVSPIDTTYTFATTKYINDGVNDIASPTDAGNLFFNPYVEFPDVYWGTSYSDGTNTF